MSEIYKALRRLQRQREEGSLRQREVRSPEDDPQTSPENVPQTQGLVEDVVRQTESILRLSEDIQRRMSEVGVDGIDGVLSLYNRLREAMDRVEAAEIDASLRDIGRLVETMQRKHDELQSIKSLKLTLEATR